MTVRSIAVLAMAAVCLGLSSPLSTAALADDDVEALIALPHSPWLALRIEQDGDYVPFYNHETLRSEITLKKRPFTIILPKRSEDDTYQISAWEDETIFAEAEPRKRAGGFDEVGVPPYFSGGTGMATTGAMTGRLVLRKRAHNYLQGLRLGPDPDRQILHVGGVTIYDDVERSSTTRLMRDVSEPIYLVVWYDEDGDDEMRHGEYEFLVLRFK